MSGRVVLAVDGGNSKTDLALAARGRRAARARARRAELAASPRARRLRRAARAAARRGARAGRARRRARADVGQLLLAGLDLPVEERAAARGGRRARLGAAHDGRPTTRSPCCAPAPSAAGASRVVCGAGINCVGVGPDGRHVRFPALGAISGDWGGGYDVGLAALSAAVRSEDGRGPRTGLERAVPAHFGLATPGELVEAIHLGRIPQRRIVELPPLVFDAAAARPGRGGDRRPARRRGARARARRARSGSSSTAPRSRCCSAAACSGPPTGACWARSRPALGAERGAARGGVAADRRRGAARARRPGRGRRRRRGRGASWHGGRARGEVSVHG